MRGVHWIGSRAGGLKSKHPLKLALTFVQTSSYNSKITLGVSKGSLDWVSAKGTVMYPAILSSVLIVLSFHWDLPKVELLHTALREFHRYRHFIRNVDIVIVTDDVSAMNDTLHTFGLESSVRLWSFNDTSPFWSGNKHDLTWEHRRVLQEEFRNNHHQTFIASEGDILIPRDHLVSWAGRSLYPLIPYTLLIPTYTPLIPPVSGQ